MSERKLQEKTHKLNSSRQSELQSASPKIMHAQNLTQLSNSALNLMSEQAYQRNILWMQQTQGNAAVQRMLADGSSTTIQRAVVRGGSAGVDSARAQRLQNIIDQYRALQASGELSQDEINQVEQAIRRAESAIRNAQDVSDKGSSTQEASMGALALAGGLAVDDVSGVGIADDIAIPFVLLAAGALWLTSQARSSSRSEIERASKTARQAVDETINTIGQILMAQQIGRQIRGLTNQIVIHLARILGTTVNGQPPDHQGDPNRNRPHWWKEIKGWIEQILNKRLTPKQLWRELTREFTPEQLAEIREALRKAAQLLGEDPPDFPPTAMP